MVEKPLITSNEERELLNNLQQQQTKNIEFAMRNNRCILTQNESKESAIRTCCMVLKIKKYTLIICPQSKTTAWFLKCARLEQGSSIIKDITDLKIDQLQRFTIIPTSTLTKHSTIINSISWSAVIIDDEKQDIKFEDNVLPAVMPTFSTLSSKYLDVCTNVSVVIILRPNFVTSDPLKIFPLLKIIKPDLGFIPFSQRYLNIKMSDENNVSYELGKNEKELEIILGKIFVY